MFSRFTAVIMAAGMVLTMAPAQAETTDGSVLTAARTVTVVTSTTGRVTLQVPADATIDLGSAPAISGEGGFVGYLLTEPGTMDGFYARATRYPERILSGATTHTSGQLAVEDRESWDPRTDPTDLLDWPEGHSCVQCPVHPGVYDLYVIADGQPVSVTIELTGLDGDVSLLEEDLAPVQSVQTDGLETSGTLGNLESTTVDGASEPVEMSAGVAFAQFELSTESGLADASHTSCIRTAGADGCDLGQTQLAANIDGGTSAIGFPTEVLPGGTYELYSLFEAQNTLQDFSWRTSADALFLEF